jgi:hypothetical protein
LVRIGSNSSGGNRGNEGVRNIQLDGRPPGKKRAWAAGLFQGAGGAKRENGQGKGSGIGK